MKSVSKSIIVGLALSILATSPQSGWAQTPVPVAVVEAGKGCPALAPIDAWGRRNLKDYLHNEAFCGDFDRDGRADALAFVHYAMGGNNQGHEVVLFRNVSGSLQFLRRVQSLSGGPQTAAFAPGKVVLNLKTMRPSDPRCCPSGRTRVVVNVEAGTHNQPR